VYSIDEVDRGTPTKALSMMLERSADFSSHVGIGERLLAGQSWLSCSLILMVAQRYLV